MKLSFAVPVYNEQSVLQTFYDRLLSVMDKLGADYEVIFVNDGSQDSSLALLLSFREQNNKVQVIDFSRNFGHQAALTAGLDQARGDCCITLDADLQHPPELIPKMVALWKEGHPIVVPVKEVRIGEGVFKRCTASGFYWLLNRISDLGVTPDVSDFRLLDRQVLDVLKSFRERHRLLRGLVVWAGFPQTTFTYVQDDRVAGHSKYSLHKMVRLGLDGITSFSRFPLQVSFYVGCVLSTFCGFYALYAIYTKLFTDRAVPGWASLMIVVTFIGSVQLLTLGVLGEYLGQIFEEAKGRPLYIVKRKYD